MDLERGAGHRMVGHKKSRVTRRDRGPSRGATRFEHVHVLIDDYSRLAYAEVLPTLTAADAVAFLRRALAWFAERGVQIQALMSDNGSAFVAHAYQRALAELGSGTCARGPTAHARTGKPSASSKRCSTNGPTNASTAAQPNAQQPCHRSSRATTSTARTAPSATSPQRPV